MGKLAEIKTRPSEQSVDTFLDSLADVQQREDCRSIIQWMGEATKEKPVMWGNALIGFGKVIYKSPATGREVEWFRMGLSPRKAQISLHLLDISKHANNLAVLGKHKTGAGCLYIKRLADVDRNILREIILKTAQEK